MLNIIWPLLIRYYFINKNWFFAGFLKDFHLKNLVVVWVSRKFLLEDLGQGVLRFLKTIYN